MAHSFSDAERQAIYDEVLRDSGDTSRAIKVRGPTSDFAPLALCCEPHQDAIYAQLLARLAPSRMPDDVSTRDVARALACAEQAYAAANGKSKVPRTQALADDFLEWAQQGAEIQKATFSEKIYSSLPEHVQDDAETDDDSGGWQLASVRFAAPSAASGVVTREEEALNRVFMYAARSIWRSAVRYAKQVSDSDGVQGLVDEGVLLLQQWVLSAAGAAQEERGNYVQWASRKEMRLQALSCLRAMPLVTAAELHGLRQAAATRAARAAKASLRAARKSSVGTAALRPHSARASAVSSAALRPTAAQRQLWAAVGAALKAVDHTLLQEWTEWAHPVFSTAACCNKWGEFLPRTRTAVDTSALDAIKSKYASGSGGAAGGAAGSEASGRGRAGTGTTSDSKAPDDVPPAHRSDAPGVDSWSDGDRSAGLRVLQQLSAADRDAAAASRAAADARPPVVPILSRDPTAEAAPSRFEFRARGVPGAAAVQQALRAGGDAAAARAPRGAKLKGDTWEDDEQAQELNIAVACAGSALTGATGHPGLANTRIVHGPAELVLQWRTPRGSPPVAFYVVETCGAEGSATHKASQWSVLLQDPPSAKGGGGQPMGGKTVRSLHPGVTYHFRVRAFNEAGASGYAFGAFSTAPLPPPAPVPVTLGPSSVKVNWGEGATCRWAAKQMSAVVAGVIGDGGIPSGSVSAPALLEALRWHGPLRTWLQSTPVDVRLLRGAVLGGAVVDAGATSIWTALEERWMALVLKAAQEAAPFGGEGQEGPGTLLAQAAARSRKDVSLPELCALLGWDLVQAAGKGGSSAPTRVSLGACVAAGAVGVLLDTPQAGDATPMPVWGGMLLPVASTGTSTPLGGTDTLRNSQMSLRSSVGSAVGLWGQSGAAARSWAWYAPDTGVSPDATAAAARGLWSCSKSAPGEARPWSAHVGAGVPSWSAVPPKGRYALLKCVGDDAPEAGCHLAPPPPVTRDGHADPHPGQTWQELGVGQGCMRGVCDLSPGSSLLLAAQALNADGIASSLSAATWVCTRLVSPPKLAVQLSPAETAHDGVSSGAALVQLQWPKPDVPSAPVLPAAPTEPQRASQDVGDSLGMSVSGDLGDMAGGPMSGATHRDPSARMALMAQAHGDNSAHQEALRAVLTWTGQQASSGGANIAGLWTAFADGGGPQVPLPVTACRALLQYVGAVHATGDGDDVWQSTALAIGADDSGLVHFPEFVRWWAGQQDTGSPLHIRRSAGVTSASAAPSRQGGDLSATGGTASDTGVSAYVDSVMAAATAVQRGEREALAALRQAARRSRGLNAALAQWEAVEAGGREQGPSTSASAGYLRSSETQLVRAAAAGAAHTEARAALITALGAHWSDPLAALVMKGTVQSQGGKRQAVDADVVPNTLYFYRAQVAAGPFASEVGPPVAVFTPPLPPFAAVVSEVGPRWARLQWHSAEHGAAKWVVEAAMLESMPAQQMLRKYARSAVRVSGAVFAGAGGGTGVPDDAELPWAVVATTSSCTALVSALSANSVYRLRVRGMNAGGVMSAPSLPTDVVTLDNTAYAPLSSHLAAQRLTVEVPLARLRGDGVAVLAAASGLFGQHGPHHDDDESVLLADIVAGDCIAWMEVVFSDGSAVPAETFDGAVTAVGRGAEMVPPPNRTTATAVATAGRSGRWGVQPQPVGIREIAGVVVSATLDASSAAAQVSAAGDRGAPSALHALSRVIATRQLLVEVVYCAMKGGFAAEDAAGAIKTGYMLSRRYSCLNDAVVRGFAALRRCPWEDEPGRWSFMEELASEYPHLMPLPEGADASVTPPQSPGQAPPLEQ